jgi:hypothetical protein
VDNSSNREQMRTMEKILPTSSASFAKKKTSLAFIGAYNEISQ